MQTSFMGLYGLVGFLSNIEIPLATTHRMFWSLEVYDPYIYNISYKSLHLQTSERFTAFIKSIFVLFSKLHLGNFLFFCCYHTKNYFIIICNDIQDACEMSIITIITDHLMSTRISSPSPHKPTIKNMASLLGSSQLAQNTGIFHCFECFGLHNTI